MSVVGNDIPGHMRWSRHSHVILLKCNTISFFNFLNKPPLHIKRNISGAGELAHQSEMFAALPEDPGSVYRAYIGCLQPFVTSVSEHRICYANLCYQA